MADLIRTPEDLASLRGRSRRLLAVFPHPDDESYGCAGTFARLGADPDAAAVFLCMTRGEASIMGPERGLSRDEVAELRARRLDEVAAILRLDGVINAALPDSGMARCTLDELVAPIHAVLDAFAPQVVIGHDPRGVNAHPDHIATHWALRDALRDRPGIRFAMLAYLQELADAIAPRLIFPTPEEEIDVVIHLTDAEAEQKERCLRIHEALVTLDENGDPELMRRPPIERYDLLGETIRPPTDDLFS